MPGGPDPSAIVTEVAKAQSTPRQLAIGHTDSGMRVAAVLEDGLHLFEGSAQATEWKPGEQYAGVTMVGLAPPDFPVAFAIADRTAIRVVDRNGAAAALIDGLQPNEQVTELQVVSGKAAGVLALVETRSAGQPARLRVLHFPIKDGKWNPATPVAMLEATPGQSAMGACSSSDYGAIVVATSQIRESGGTVRAEAQIAIWRNTAKGEWRRATDLLSPAVGQSLNTTLTFAPGALVARCAAEGAIDIVFRSGAGWLMHGTSAGDWSEPRRMLDYSPGYGVQGRSTAFCSDRLVWIDNRLEKGTNPKLWNPTGGFPWSDDYPGWGINGVFSAPIADLGRANLLSSKLGRQHTVAAVSSGKECAAVWSGQTSVPKAAGNADELATRIMVGRL